MYLVDVNKLINAKVDICEVTTSWLDFAPLAVVQIENVHIVEIFVVETVVVIATKDDQLFLGQNHPMATPRRRP